MFLLTVLVCSLGALVTSVPEKEFYDIERAHEYFEDFIIEYKKEYKTEAEKQERFEIFKNNLVNLNFLNKRDEETIHGITMFTDLTKEEYNTKYNSGYGGWGTEIACQRFNWKSNSSLRAPATFDWRGIAVGPVKNQKLCSSCWAFASIGIIEGRYAMKYRSLKQFSEQQLLDCSIGHTGCQRGYYTTNGILDLVSQGGVMLEHDYPYTATDGQCRADRSRFVAKVLGCRQFVIQREEELMDILYTYGPLGIAVDATNWATYRGGIFTSCSNVRTTHAALLVGYGVEANSPYWIIKNSYGMEFGERGYIRIPRGKNACLITKGPIVSALVG